MVFQAKFQAKILLLNWAPVRQVVVFLERAAAEGLEGDQPRAERAPLRDGGRLHSNLQSQGKRESNDQCEEGGSAISGFRGAAAERKNGGFGIWDLEEDDDA